MPCKSLSTTPVLATLASLALRNWSCVERGQFVVKPNTACEVLCRLGVFKKLGVQIFDRLGEEGRLKRVGLVESKERKRPKKSSLQKWETPRWKRWFAPKPCSYKPITKRFWFQNLQLWSAWDVGSAFALIRFVLSVQLGDCCDSRSVIRVDDMLKVRGHCYDIHSEYSPASFWLTHWVIEPVCILWICKHLSSRSCWKDLFIKETEACKPLASSSPLVDYAKTWYVVALW